MTRNEFIIQSSKKLKALKYTRDFCDLVLRRDEDRDTLQSKIDSEVKMTLMLLNNFLGAENVKKWKDM